MGRPVSGSGPSVPDDGEKDQLFDLLVGFQWMMVCDVLLPYVICVVSASPCCRINIHSQVTWVVLALTGWIVEVMAWPRNGCIASQSYRFRFR